VDELKAQARYEITSDPTLEATLTQKIKAARIWIERYCQIAMLEQTIEIRYPCFPSRLPMEVTPIRSITHLKYWDANKAEQTVTATDYRLNDWTSTPYLHLLIDVPTVYEKYDDPVNLQYKAGFGTTADDVPDDLKEAVLILATKMEADRIEPGKALGLVGNLIHTYKNEYARL